MCLTPYRWAGGDYRDSGVLGTRLPTCAADLQPGRQTDFAGCSLPGGVQLARLRQRSNSIHCVKYSVMNDSYDNNVHSIYLLYTGNTKFFSCY